MRLSDFRVLTFDCYGTLIDWEGGLATAWIDRRDLAG
jgi:FMN phosphatase YigB (HAD superfamily)